MEASLQEWLEVREWVNVRSGHVSCYSCHSTRAGPQPLEQVSDEYRGRLRSLMWPLSLTF